MSILIKGMEMPKGNDSIALFIYPDGVVVMYEMFGPLGRYTAVPVPKHGRLIDADALEDDDPDICNSFMRDGYVESCEWGYSHEQIKNAPTVIPAEEEEA